jgi:hypothetical protein
VLLECGRARVHTLRNALNAVSLGVELLDDSSVPNSRAASLRQQIGEAAAEIEGLQALILETAQPQLLTLPDAAAWALRMTTPVARRRSVELVVPFPVYDLPSVSVSPGFSVALSEVLVTACLASNRGTRCTITGSSGKDIALSVEWQPGKDAVTERLDSVYQMMTKAIAPAGRTDLSRDDARQRMTMHFREVA